jgi:uncharacterized protein YodC (DUF2158 family)
MGKLKVGDWVRRKSGGKVMTVVEVGRFGNTVKCSWFDKGGVRRTASFDKAALNLVRETKSGG